MASLCLSHQDASTDMQHGLFWSLRDLDLRSNFDLDLTRSNHIPFEASLPEKYDDIIADSLSISSKVIRERIFRPKQLF